MHLGMSESYAAKKSKYKSRVLDRAIYGLAKTLYNAMMEGTLDSITQRTFRINSRKIKDVDMMQTDSDDSERNQQNLERERRYKKGRVRNLKGRVANVIKLPRSEWDQFVGPEWLARFELLIKPMCGFK